MEQNALKLILYMTERKNRLLTTAFHNIARHMKIWLNRSRFTNRMVSVLFFISIICGILTYIALAGVPPFGKNSTLLIVMLNLDLVILLILLVVVCRRLIVLYTKRKRGVIGSSLHIRLVSIFSLIAAVPAIFMAIFSVGFFYFGLHGWLDERVRTAIEESEAVAEAYLDEHRQLIRADILAMASDLNRQSAFLKGNPDALQRMIETQAYLRNFSNVFLFNSVGSISAQSNPDDGFNISSIDMSAIQKAQNNEVVLIADTQNSIRAFLQLSSYDDLFLLGDRMVDPKVLGHVERTHQGVAQYEDLQRRSTDLQILLTSIYILITLLLTIAAIWLGLSFARRLMAPITALIQASESVGQGNLKIRVDTNDALDEFKMLGRAFNRMTDRIDSQQQELIKANDQMDFRRRFTETILGGVSTGIISVDNEGRITLANNSSGLLLCEDIQNLLGQKVSHVMPELMPYLDEAFDDLDNATETKTCEIRVRRGDDSIRIFMARIVVEKIREDEVGAIITFDDLTSVLSAQRKAAWADVARRIAHEIKNPLTPIQLSAERLNRKYSKNLSKSDQQIFMQCTDTIVRHVSDIKTMVNAFADFAKMPDPVMERKKILPILSDIIALHQSENDKNKSEINFYVSDNVNANDLEIMLDEQQIRQVLTNLIKNAFEAITGQDHYDHVVINVLCCVHNKKIWIGINDNGPGLPTDDVESLTEPYVTHKRKGTGLGLAIVKKIIEDHGGELLFSMPQDIIKKMVDSYTVLPGASIFFTIPIQD